MEAIDALRVQFRDEDPAQFNTGEYIDRGTIYPSIHAFLASPAGRSLLNNGRKPRK
jgi:hypothetical protein